MAGRNLVAENSCFVECLTVIKRNVKKDRKDAGPEKKRVAAYCRVSNGLDGAGLRQQIELQLEVYKKVIHEHIGWELAGIYADEGLSVSIEKRTEFQRMIKDAENGKIDVILAQSISGFTRNTQEAIQYTRYLKKKGVTVYFEQEGIHTEGFSSELMLTVFAAFAQKEREGIPEEREGIPEERGPTNTKQGLKNRFKIESTLLALSQGARSQEAEKKKAEKKKAVGKGDGKSMVAPSVVVRNSNFTDGLTVIKRNVRQAYQGTAFATKRVAAYCRVSTDLEEQDSSLKLQIEAYTMIINEHRGWELVGIYADEGLSGTSVERRIEFQRMIKDADSGKIDVIMAKSISRFARNTKDTLQYTRYLQSKGVSVYFEKEGIDTSSFSSEFMLTILAAFAQEESHSISENTKKGIRNRFKMGIPMWSNTYGLVEGWKINEKEAKDIRLIFNLFVADRTVAEVAAELNRRNIPTPGSTKKWDKDNVGRVLTNEKYVGDVLMQKTYVSDFMEHRSLENKDALVEQYYKKDHHEAIVDRETFNKAQKLYTMRSFKNGSVLYPYYGILKCPCCGENMVKVKVGGATNTTAWTCGGEGEMTRLGDRTCCPTYLLQDKVLTSHLVDIIKELEPYSAENEEFARAIFDAQCDCKENNSISFKTVDTLVETISMDDWEHLTINWKMGWSDRYEIKYSYLREVILPIIEDKGKGRYECFGNFIQLKDYFLERFQKRQQRVLDYEVIEPPYGDCKVPKLISPELQKRMEDRKKEKK